MKLSDELEWRGFINQTTLPEIGQLNSGPISFYFGVDPSADSMTIGNLAAAMMVRHLIDAGHNAYLLVGGATGLIGDPDGKKEQRPAITLEQLAHNKAALASQYRQIFSGKNFEIVDNFDWFQNINYMDFLRNVGRHVPLSSMLGRDFVQSRLGEGGNGISYAEFSYSLIQGYDFLHLYRTKGVTLQLCGADQWGNSIAGVDMIRRIESGEAHVLSTPLVINKSTGKKFGKSEDGAVWIDAKKTTPYAFYQFWLNLDDEGVIDYTKIYTLLSKDEISELQNQASLNPGSRLAQKRLAYEVTKIVHGEETAKSVENVTGVLFGGTSVNELSDTEVNMLSEAIPTVSVGAELLEVLVSTKVASSKGEARRLVEAGAISINGTKVSIADASNTVQALCLIKKGKNVFVLVR